MNWEKCESLSVGLTPDVCAPHDSGAAAAGELLDEPEQDRGDDRIHTRPRAHPARDSKDEHLLEVTAARASSTSTSYI